MRHSPDTQHFHQHPTAPAQHHRGAETEPKARHSGTGSLCSHRSEQPGDVCGTDRDTTHPTLLQRSRRGPGSSTQHPAGPWSSPSPLAAPCGRSPLTSLRAGRVCVPVSRSLVTQNSPPESAACPGRAGTCSTAPSSQPGVWGLRARAFWGSRWLGKRPQGTGSYQAPGINQGTQR